jgi:phage tail tape-measure protein
MTTKVKEQDLNLDPITGQPGSHPLGTGAGSAGTAAVGAAIGAVVGGPVGFAVGGAIGAVAGGVAGHEVAEKVNPTVEDSYWRDNYSKRPYAHADRDYKFYQPAYKYGWESRANLKDAKWDDVESQLDAGWMMRRGESTLEWNDARPAAQDAWNRIDGLQF